MIKVFEIDSTTCRAKKIRQFVQLLQTSLGNLMLQNKTVAYAEILLNRRNLRDIFNWV